MIELIAQDPLLSSAGLAKQLYVSAATVRRRRKRLVESGVLRVLLLPDPYKTGFPVTCVIALHIDHSCLDSALAALAAKREVRWLASTTGRFDALAMAYFASTDEIHDFMVGSLTDVPGIKDSETFVCLSVRKRGTVYLGKVPAPGVSRLADRPLGPLDRHVIPPA